MGAFDHLIPKNGKAAPQKVGQPTRNAGPKRPGAFDHLIPQGADFSDVRGGSSSKPAGPRRYDWAEHERKSKRQFTQAEVEAMNPVERWAHGAHQTLGGLTRGARQLGPAAAAAILPDGMDDPFQRRVAELEAEEARVRAAEAPLADTAAGKVGRGTGHALSMMLPVSKVGALPRAGQYVANTALGAASGALAPTVKGESRAANIGTSAAFGAAGQGMSHGLEVVGKRAAAAVTPHMRQMADKARQLGTHLSLPELSDNVVVKWAGRHLDNLPGSGAGTRTQARTQAVNRELAKKIGQNADAVDQDVMATAYGEMGDEYDRLFAGGMQYDREFLKDIAAIRREAREQMDDTAIRTIDNLIGRVKAQGKGGQLPGRTLQSIDQKARKAQTGGGDRQQVAGAFRDALRANMTRTAGPQVRDQLKDLNRRYATYKTLEPLVARNPQGGIPPQQLLGAVNATKRGKAAMARGQGGDLAELAMLGQMMKGPRSSGTPEGVASAALGTGAMTGNLLALGTLGVGPLAGRVLNSGTLARMYLNRGDTLQHLAPLPRYLGVIPPPDLLTADLP